MRHYEISQIYSSYIKRLVNFIAECRILDLAYPKQVEYIKRAPVEDVIWMYNQVKDLLGIIVNKFYANSLFCCKYRIYRNVLKLLYIDVMRFYKLCYSCVTETVGNLENLNLEQLNRVYEMCVSFINFTEEVQKQVDAMASQLKESSHPVIPYFKAAPDLLSNLQTYIKAKEEMNKNDDEEKNIVASITKQDPVPEEYNLEDKKENEYNFDNQNLDDFMTSIKQSAVVKAADPYHGRYSAVPATSLAQAPAVQAKKTTEDEEIFGFAQGATTGLDELEQLFGETPELSKSGLIPTLGMQNSKAQAYEQLSHFNNVYQQPNIKKEHSSYGRSDLYLSSVQPLTSSQGMNQYGHINMHDKEIISSKPASSNPFDLFQSKYAGVS
eukprot:TRINITY_DN1762_c0_g1_i19.p1 TRINITY_DN1762_c0_g1~~TRINITY_DN1762_c0_g1_i19.p1  ORF type:complete len:382 (-),score=108.03 TRINITY_DN1762_c0_g1_i19:101-1246(-)